LVFGAGDERGEELVRLGAIRLHEARDVHGVEEAVRHVERGESSHRGRRLRIRRRRHRAGIRVRDGSRIRPFFGRN
jgi:hypothetical protein